MKETAAQKAIAVGAVVVIFLIFVVALIGIAFGFPEIWMNEGGSVSSHEEGANEGGGISSHEERTNEPLMGVEMPDGSLYGNVPGNVAHVGTTNAFDGWLYYNSLNEIGKLCRMRFDGSEKATVDDHGALYVSMLDGWVYYINYERRICRSSPDGSVREYLSEFSAFYLNIVDGWLYFTKGEPGVSFLEGGIWKMRPDGSDMEMLHEGFAQNLVAFDGWLYFVAPRSDEGRSEKALFRLDLEGNSVQQLNESVYTYVVAGDWIFFTSLAEQGLFKMKVDGSAVQKVSDANPIDMNAWGDWIYYVDMVDDATRPLYRLDIETSEVSLVSDKNCDSVDVVDDRLLIQEWPGEYGMRVIPYDNKRYIADLDGANIRLVEEWVD